MASLAEQRKKWQYLMCRMYRKELIEELKCRYVVHWNYRCYEKLPSELLVFGLHVEEIYLKGNKLLSLPNWLNSLRNLTHLFLEGNSLCELPSAIGDCRILDTLAVEDNQIAELPESFSNLRNLTSLNLKGNRIAKLPKGFDNLKALTFLNLSNNGIKSLPESICNLRSLQELILDGNKLRYLPRQIVTLPNLSYVSVCRNLLEFLPLTLFVNHASVSFMQNPPLSYLHYDLGCELSRNSFVVASDFDDEEAWRLDMSGCAESQTSVPECDCLRIKLDTDQTAFRLPKELKSVHRVYGSFKSEQPPTLFELSLRQAHEQIAESGFSSVPMMDIDCLRYIPSLRILIDGPVTRCSNVSCSEAVFTEGVLWTLQMTVTNIEIPTRTMAAILFFCSGRCSRSYADANPSKVALRVNWSLA